MWNQVKDANWRIPYVGGWCEGYVEGAWGIATLPTPSNQTTSGVYGSAIAKWNANPGNGNHPDEQPPVGKTVAVYFSLGSTNLGHTAIALDDGTVASSTQAGYHTQGYLHPSLQNLIDVYAQYNNGCTYLGWSEFVGNTRVLELAQVNATVAEIEQDYQDILGRAADPAGLAHYQNYTNDFVRQDLLNSQEYKTIQENKAAAAAAAKAQANAAAQAQAAADAQATAAAAAAAAQKAAQLDAQPAQPVDTTVKSAQKNANPPTSQWYQTIINFFVYLFKNIILGVK